MASIVHLAPGSEAISEFARQSNGAYLTATCVETAALMCLCGVKPVDQVAPADIGNYLQQMVNAWRAADPGVSAGGASNYVDATNWLRSQGVTVDENLLDQPGFNWWPELQAGCASGYTYLVGVTNAQALPGDEAGVHNHGLAALGIDSDGNIVCGDPDNWHANENMPGNPVGAFVTYTQQDFLNGQISSLTRVHPMALDISQVASYFTAQADGSWKCAETGATLSGAFLAFYRAMTAAGTLAGLTALGLPAADDHYLDQGKYPGAVAQVFERGVLVYDPDRHFDSPPGATGAIYAAHFLPFVPAPAPAPAPPAEPDADDAALAAAQAQVTQLTANNAQLQQEVSALQGQLASAHQTLSQQAADALTAIAAIKTALADPPA